MVYGDSESRSDGKGLSRFRFERACLHVCVCMWSMSVGDPVNFLAGETELVLVGFLVRLAELVACVRLRWTDPCRCTHASGCIAGCVA